MNLDESERAMKAAGWSVGDLGFVHAARIRWMVSAHRPDARVHTVAPALLAPPGRDFALLCGADSGGEVLALSEGLGF
jgi:hypothetical protein